MCVAYGSICRNVSIYAETPRLNPKYAAEQAAAGTPLQNNLQNPSRALHGRGIKLICGIVLDFAAAAATAAAATRASDEADTAAAAAAPGAEEGEAAEVAVEEAVVRPPPPPQPISILDAPSIYMGHLNGIIVLQVVTVPELLSRPAAITEAWPLYRRPPPPPAEAKVQAGSPRAWPAKEALPAPASGTGERPLLLRGVRSTWRPAGRKSSLRRLIMNVSGSDADAGSSRSQSVTARSTRIRQVVVASCLAVCE
eukprot:COSAG05_NODE_1607_length_4414_cov_2.784241_4_plen_254_part_00